MSEQTTNQQTREEAGHPAELSDESLEQVSGGETEGGCFPGYDKLSQIFLATI